MSDVIRDTNPVTGEPQTKVMVYGVICIQDSLLLDADDTRLRSAVVHEARGLSLDIRDEVLRVLLAEREART